jgi:hypothetical protein
LAGWIKGLSMSELSPTARFMVRGGLAAAGAIAIGIALGARYGLPKEVLGGLIALGGGLIGAFVGSATTLQIERERRREAKEGEEKRRREDERRERAVARGVARVVRDRFEIAATTIEAGAWPAIHELQLPISDEDRKMLAGRLTSWSPVARGEMMLLEIAAKDERLGKQLTRDEQLFQRFQVNALRFAARTLEPLTQSEVSHRAAEQESERLFKELLEKKPN